MDIPEACTLPDAERPLRLTEFETLFAEAVASVRRLGPGRLRLELSGQPDLEERVRDLTARESECCSFFTFTLTADAPGAVRLDIEVPAAHVDVVDSLQRLAAGS